MADDHELPATEFRRHPYFAHRRKLAAGKFTNDSLRHSVLTHPFAMILSKLSLAVATLISAAAILCWQHVHLEREQGTVSHLRVELEQAQHQAESLRKQAETARAEFATRQAEVSRLQAESAGKASVADTISAPVSKPGEHETGYVALSKAHLKQFRVKPFTEEFRLTDAAAALLGMNEPERAAVNRITGRLIAKHQQMDLARVRQIDEHLTSEPGRKTSFKVPAYPEEGQALAQEALSATVHLLGPARTDLLMHYADLGSLSAEGFEPFGRTEKTITFLDRFNEDGSRGDCRILMRVVDSATGMALATSFANDTDRIPPPWRHLIQDIYPPAGAASP